MFLTTLFKYKSSLHRACNCRQMCVQMSLGELFHGFAILLRRKWVLDSFPDVRSRECWNEYLFLLNFAPVLVICFHRTSWPSLDRVQSCKSGCNLLYLVLFSGLSNLVFWVIRKVVWFFHEGCSPLETFLPYFIGNKHR